MLKNCQLIIIYGIHIFINFQQYAIKIILCLTRFHKHYSLIHQQNMGTITCNVLMHQQYLTGADIEILGETYGTRKYMQSQIKSNLHHINKWWCGVFFFLFRFFPPFSSYPMFFSMIRFFLVLGHKYLRK